MIEAMMKVTAVESIIPRPHERSKINTDRTKAAADEESGDVIGGGAEIEPLRPIHVLSPDR